MSSGWFEITDLLLKKGVKHDAQTVREILSEYDGSRELADVVNDYLKRHGLEPKESKTA